MLAPRECSRCHGPMEPGFVMDRGDHNGLATQKWVEGVPEKSFWQGLKTKGRETREVTTSRCERCGYLESFAL